VFLSAATSTPALYTLSLHDALPIFASYCGIACSVVCTVPGESVGSDAVGILMVREAESKPWPNSPRWFCWISVSSNASSAAGARSEEHTSELQSLAYLVCRLLLEKK